MKPFLTLDEVATGFKGESVHDRSVVSSCVAVEGNGNNRVGMTRVG